MPKLKIVVPVVCKPPPASGTASPGPPSLLSPLWLKLSVQHNLHSVSALVSPWPHGLSSSKQADALFHSDPSHKYLTGKYGSISLCLKDPSQTYITGT